MTRKIYRKAMAWMLPTKSILLTEVKLLFFSPIAWSLIFVFTLTAYLGYSDRLQTIVNIQETGYNESDQITKLIFWNPANGLIGYIISYLMYFVPLITMGLISREVESGSIKLLQSSPISPSSVVIGKYTAIVLYGIVLCAIVVSTAFVTNVLARKIDNWVIVSGTLGVFLVFCSYAAVGMFASSCTRHQIVAAIGTLALLGLIENAYRLGQRIPIFGDISFWFAPSMRVFNLRSGLITLSDLSYYITVIGIFLWLSTQRVGSMSTSRRPRLTALLAVPAALACVAVILSSPQFDRYYDVTRTQENVLSRGARKVLLPMEMPWVITAYVNVLDPRAPIFMPENIRGVKRKFEEFRRERPNVDFQVKYYVGKSINPGLYTNNPGKNDQELASEIARQNDLDESEFVPRSVVDRLIGETAQPYDNFYVISGNGKSAILRNFYTDGNYFPIEIEIAATMRRLSNGAVSFAYDSGQGARSPLKAGDGQHFAYTSMTSYRGALINHGIDSSIIPVNGNVPLNADVVVITGDLTEQAQTATSIENYLKNGGNAIIAAEASTLPAISHTLSGAGITLEGSVASSGVGPTRIGLAKSQERPDLVFPSWVVSPLLLMNNPVDVCVSAAGFSIENLFVRETQYPTAVDCLGESGVVGQLLTRKLVGRREQRILVLGDADFFADYEILRQEPQTRNTAMIENLTRWVTNGDVPIDVSRLRATDRAMNIDRITLRKLNLIFLVFIPAFTAMFGGWLVLRRRRRGKVAEA